MKDQLLQRLNELTAEFAKGEKAMARIEAEWKNTRDSLLRISGAIQVLKEELAKEPTLLNNNLPDLAMIQTKNLDDKTINGKIEISEFVGQLNR